MLRIRPLPTHDYPHFSQDHLHLQPLQPQFLEYFSPQRSMFETNPETCFVHDLCPPTTTPLSPRIISICNPFSLNFLNISAHNEACLRLTLKHASRTTSVHPPTPLSPRIISICNPFNINFLNISARNEAYLKLTLKHASYSASAHPHPSPFPHDYFHLQLLQPQFLEYFSPQQSMFEINPEICFVHGLCPPTTTPLFPRIVSICNPFNLNILNISSHNDLCPPTTTPFSPNKCPSASPSTPIFLNISDHNEACLRLTLKHASSTTSVHPFLSAIMSICNPFNLNFLEYFSPQRSMFETNPETCFVHDLCPPTTTPIFP